MLKDVHLNKSIRRGITTWRISFEFTDRENFYSLSVNDHLGWDGVALQLAWLSNVLETMWQSYYGKEKDKP